MARKEGMKGLLKDVNKNADEKDSDSKEQESNKEDDSRTQTARRTGVIRKMTLKAVKKEQR